VRGLPVIGSTVCPPHTSLMDEVQGRTGLVVLIGILAMPQRPHPASALSSGPMVIGERRTLHENIRDSNARIQWL
jgi:hypothetical protein